LAKADPWFLKKERKKSRHSFATPTNIGAQKPIYRAFNVEWRAAYSGRPGTANFEVRLYENQTFFDIVYGTDCG